MRYTYTLLTLLLVLAFSQMSILFGQGVGTQALVIGEPHPTLGGYIFYLNGDGGGLIVYEDDLVNDQFNGLSIFRWTEPENLRTKTNLAYYDFNDWTRTASQSDRTLIDAYGNNGNYAALEIERQLGSEWRLPTATEAYWMNFHLNSNGLGNFARGLYWTSSEVLFESTSVPPPYAVAIDMTTGRLSSKMAKIQALRVRPVRSF